MLNKDIQLADPRKGNESRGTAQGGLPCWGSQCSYGFLLQMTQKDYKDLNVFSDTPA